MPDGTSSSLSQVKISELPVAPAANATDQLEANQSGTTRSITVGQVGTVVGSVIVAGLGVVSPLNFGAIGNGIADDTAAMQAAINAAAGKILDGAGLTYKINSTLALTGNNTTIQNITFDFSGNTSANCLTAFGVNGTGLPLTADAPINSNVINIADTSSLVVDNLVWFDSNAFIDVSTSAKFGQWGRVKAINSATQFTLYANLVVNFLMSDAAQVNKPTVIGGLVVRDCKFIGAGANLQIGLYLYECDHPQILRCDFRNFDNGALAVSRCYKPLVEGCSIRKGVAAGLAYGIEVIGGCYHAKIVNNHGEDLRHTVTIGGTNGINLYTLVQGNHAINSKDAGMDSHPSAMFTTYANNLVEMSAQQFGASSHDGLVSQSSYTTIIGNTVRGPLFNGILYQAILSNGVPGGVLIANNKIVLNPVGLPASSSGIGISVDMAASNTSDIAKVIIANNEVTAGSLSSSCYGIYVRARNSGCHIKKVTISGNQISDATNAGIVVQADAGGFVDSLTLTDNNVETTNVRAVYIYASATGAAITNIIAQGNVLKSGNLGFALDTAAGATIGPGKFGKNIYTSIVDTSIIQLGVGTPTGVTFQDADDAPTINYSSNIIYTVPVYANSFIFSRAAAITVTLPDPTLWKGRSLNIRNTTAFAITSATANVVPLAGGAATTAILTATAGKFAILRCDGTNWNIVNAN